MEGGLCIVAMDSPGGPLSGGTIYSMTDLSRRAGPRRKQFLCGQAKFSYSVIKSIGYIIIWELTSSRLCSPRKYTLKDSEVYSSMKALRDQEH